MKISCIYGPLGRARRPAGKDLPGALDRFCRIGPATSGWRQKLQRPGVLRSHRSYSPSACLRTDVSRNPVLSPAQASSGPMNTPHFPMKKAQPFMAGTGDYRRTSPVRDERTWISGPRMSRYLATSGLWRRTLPASDLYCGGCFSKSRRAMRADCLT